MRADRDRKEMLSAAFIQDCRRLVDEIRRVQDRRKILNKLHSIKGMLLMRGGAGNEAERAHGLETRLLSASQPGLNPEERRALESWLAEFCERMGFSREKEEARHTGATVAACVWREGKWTDVCFRAESIVGLLHITGEAPNGIPFEAGVWLPCAAAPAREDRDGRRAHLMVIREGERIWLEWVVGIRVEPSTRDSHQTIDIARGVA